MSIDYRTVGLRIRRNRLEHKITQEELAFLVSTSAAYISNIERGRKRPSLEKLSEIADILGVTLNDLVYTSQNRPLTNNKELNEMMSLCPPDTQRILLNNICDIVRTFITK